MNYYEIQKIYGVVKDFHPRMIPPDKASDVDNIMFWKGVLKRRPGYLAFGSNLPLSGTITGLFYFRQLKLDERFIIATTEKDTYKYNFNSDRWDYITRNHSTGTVDATVGAESVLDFTGSDFDTNWSGFMWIKFGNTDMNEGVEADWHSVSSINSATQLTISDSVDLSGGNYVLRLCWNGNEDDYHSFAEPYDSDENDKILIISNGIDDNQKFTGVGDMLLLGYIETTGDTTDGSAVLSVLAHDNISTGMTVTGTGIPADSVVMSVSPTLNEVTINNDATITDTDVDLIFDAETPPAKFVGYYGSVGFDHTILANVVEGVYPEPQKILTSIAGDPEDFYNGAFYQLLNSNDAITGIIPLKTRLICYKEKSITEIWAVPQGDNDNPFDFNQNKINDIGTPSIRTVVNYGDFHIFLGEESTGIDIFIFDGVSVQRVGRDIINYISDQVSHKYLSRAFAIPIQSRNLYCLFVSTGSDSTNMNDKCYTFNYVEGVWSIWTLNDFMSAYSSFAKSDVLFTWSDMVTDTTATVATGTPNVTIASTVGMSAGMRFDVNSGAETHYIQSVESTTTLILDGNVTADGSQVVRWGHTWDTYPGDIRWRDVLTYDNNNAVSYLVGDNEGYIYEFAEEHEDDNATEIECTIETGDHPLNDREHTFRLLKATVSMQDGDPVTDDGGTIDVGASVDFGANWTPYINLTIEGAVDYIEGVANFMERGKQVRFRFRNIDGGDINIESVLVGFNDMGIKK